MPNFALPQIQIPKMVAPSSAAPKDVISAAAANEDNLMESLFRAPLSAMGLTLPKLPGPAGIASQLAASLPEPPAPPGFPAGAATIGPEKVPTKPAARVWKIGI